MFERELSFKISEHLASKFHQPCAESEKRYNNYDSTEVLVASGVVIFGMQDIFKAWILSQHGSPGGVCQQQRLVLPDFVRPTLGPFLQKNIPPAPTLPNVLNAGTLVYDFSFLAGETNHSAMWKSPCDQVLI